MIVSSHSKRAFLEECKDHQHPDHHPAALGVEQFVEHLFAAGARRVGTDHQYENQCKEQRQPDQVFDGADQVCFHRFTDGLIGAKIM